MKIIKMQLVIYIFKKLLTIFFNNLTPRYKEIEHKVSNGETFDKILESYSISSP